MAGVIYITSDTPLPNGEKLIRGLVTPDSSYAAGGFAINLTNYILSTDYPTVICDSASGYVFSHDKGTSAAGKIIAYQNVFNTTTVNSTAMNAPLYQAHTGLNLSTINVGFHAIGKQY